MQSAVLNYLAAERQAVAVPPPMPPAPGTLDPAGAAKWRDLVPILQGRGNVSAGDLTALECLCAAWQLWRAAQAQIADGGLVADGKENPFLGIARKAQVAVRQWAAELRLTPKSRKQDDLNPPSNFDEGG